MEKHDKSNGTTEVYLVDEQSCIHGDCRHNLIGIFSSLEKAQNAYENARLKAEIEFKPDELWYQNEEVQSTDVYFEMMDNTLAPEKYYQLRLEEQTLQ